MKSFPYRHVLAAAVCLLLAMPAWGAEDAPAPPPPAPSDAAAGTGDVQALIDQGRFEEAIVALRPLLQQEPIEPNVLFLYGLASLQASQRPDRTDEDREILLNEAITAFHAMLVEAPGLVRVRLELARAFFLKGEDDLARRHFEAVLAGGVPEPVAANVQRFLDEIRARGRWSFNVGFALAPDTNIGSGSDVRTIYIPVFGQPLPFQRDAAQLTTSGVGVSVWGGAEYQVPLAERWRLRAGGQASRREYEGSQFDQLYLGTHLGPRWLVDENTEGSLLASARQHWTGTAPDNRELGARLEVARRLTPTCDGIRKCFVARPALPDAEPPGRPGVGRVAQGLLGGDADGAGATLGRLRGAAVRTGARAQQQPVGGRGCFGHPAAGLHGGRRGRGALDRLRRRVDSAHAAGARTGRTARTACGSRSTTGPSPSMASAPSLWRCTRSALPTRSSTTTSARAASCASCGSSDRAEERGAKPGNAGRRQGSARAVGGRRTPRGRFAGDGCSRKPAPWAARQLSGGAPRRKEDEG